MGVCATCKTISLPCNNNGECVDSQQSNSNQHSIQKNISTSTTANNKEMTNISYETWIKNLEIHKITNDAIANLIF